MRRFFWKIESWETWTHHVTKIFKSVIKSTPLFSVKMATYRTRSNTQKLQRLIEFLKERDCDSAANLESSAEVFLNDVKQKNKPNFCDATGRSLVPDFISNWFLNVFEQCLITCTPLRNGNSSSLKCLGRTLYFLKRVYPRVFKNGKMKIFHTYPKE